MKKANCTSGFFISFAVNLLLIIFWTVPAIVLLITHMIFNISVWWFIGALGLWATVTGIWTLFLCLAANCSSKPDIQKENKNPYSTNPNNIKK